jgi:hypothetical protein
VLWASLFFMSMLTHEGTMFADQVCSFTMGWRVALLGVAWLGAHANIDFSSRCDALSCCFYKLSVLSCTFPWRWLQCTVVAQMGVAAMHS